MSNLLGQLTSHRYTYENLHLNAIPIQNSALCLSMPQQVQSSELSIGKIRLLIAFTNFGTKNIGLLNEIIKKYRSMPFEVNVVALSNVEKDLGPEVKIVVGLPNKNPWSLPFAHKRILSENVNEYDLFIYSEDDMVVSFENIMAFLKITPSLAENEIAAFLRYEVDESGNWSLPDAQAGFHWKADSIRVRGQYTVAEFTNEHSGFYILTQNQLRKAIASGGFLTSPYIGEYDLPCTAATDPYLKCGFRRVICISHLQEFFIHHSSNRYVGQTGLSFKEFQLQVRALMLIKEGGLPAIKLFETETKLFHRQWSKSIYGKPRSELIDLIPTDAKSILSFGSGTGELEILMHERGVKVTAIALDSVIGFSTQNLGFEVIYGDRNSCFSKLEGRKFDCVVTTNVFHLVSDAKSLLDQLSEFVRADGYLIIGGPHLESPLIRAKRFLGKGGYQKLGKPEESGVYFLKFKTIQSHIQAIGFTLCKTVFFNSMDPFAPTESKWLGHMKRLLANNWAIQARRKTLSK